MTWTVIISSIGGAMVGCSMALLVVSCFANIMTIDERRRAIWMLIIGLALSTFGIGMG